MAKGFNDMEVPQHAMTMTRVAASCAKDAEHPGLIALTDGLKSLIAHWADRPGDAYHYANELVHGRRWRVETLIVDHVGAGAKHKLVFVDRLLATLVHLRHGATHDVLACWFAVDRSTITRAIGEVRPLLAQRGCTIAPGLRLRTLAENEKTGIIDGTEIRVRRPAAGRKDRDKFISGKNKQNAVKSMVFTDADGRLLYCSPAEPESCADITHARKLGLVKVLLDGPGGDPRGCRLPGPGRTDWRTGGDPATPQVQVERPGLVRGDP
ncbi:transposase family protein [Streptomyces chartreusis]